MWFRKPKPPPFASWPIVRTELLGDQRPRKLLPRSWVVVDDEWFVYVGPDVATAEHNAEIAKEFS